MRSSDRGGARAEDEAGAPATEAALSRDEKLILLKTRLAELELEKAKVKTEEAELELKDTQSLFEENIVTVNELRKAERAYKEASIEHSEAKIRLEQTRLEFLKNATLIRVVGAKIFRGDNTEVMALIEVQNASDINKARVVMSLKEHETEGGDEALAALFKVDSITVTLWGTAYVSSGSEERVRAAKAIIGEPFQQIIPELKFGETVPLKFRLLKKDIEQVSVQIEYLDTSKEYDVFLTKETSEDLPTITSSQFDQHGDLGTTIRYNLRLERLAKTEQSFSLRVLNFPEGVRFAFIDPKTKARMTTLKFSSEESIRTVDFEVSIPEKLDSSLIDTNLPFYIIVAWPAEMEKIHELKKEFGDKEIPAEEIAKIKGNMVELILIPKGVGQLDILVGNLFQEIQQGEGVVLKFSMMNSGTLAVRRVTPKMDLPLEWEGEIVPAQIAIVEPDEKVLVTANVRPPEGIAIGEYTIRMEAEGHSGVEIIEAKEKDFTVKIVTQSRLTGTVVLVVILIVLVLGIAVASIKISRR